MYHGLSCTKQSDKSVLHEWDYEEDSTEKFNNSLIPSGSIAEKTWKD